MKKNTLLYLDSALVERAKRENINVSRLVEDALRQTLNINPPRTAYEYVRRMFADTGCENAYYGEAYLLPFQIESLKLENIGPLKEFEAKFVRDSLNVIYGLNGSGKSSIVRSILFAFGKRHKYFQTSDDGRVTLRLFPDQGPVSVTTSMEDQSGITRGFRCLIVDGMLQKVRAGLIPAFFEELKSLRIQIIIAASVGTDLSMLPERTNVVSLKSSRS